MSKKTRNNLLLLAVVVSGGVLLRILAARRIRTYLDDKVHKEMIDSNPWLMQTAAMDAFQYYTVSDAHARFVYGVGNEVDMVSTGMLNTALQELHSEIITEVQQMYQTSLPNYEEYFSNRPDMTSPYWQEINQAASSNINTD